MVQNNEGPATDRHNDPVSDPTSNVLDLVEAAIKRQDDLREADGRYLREMVQLRAEYDGKLREAESARIDAIRAVDVNAVQRAAEVSAIQATTLAAQVAASAEALRIQVAQADVAARSNLAIALEPVNTSIADLRRAQYEAQGIKATAAENTVERRDVGMGQRAWIGIAISVAALLSAMILGIAGIVITLLLR